MKNECKKLIRLDFRFIFLVTILLILSFSSALYAVPPTLLTVNCTSESDKSDKCLTLNEALKLVTGLTSGTDAIHTPLSSTEQDQITFISDLDENIKTALGIDDTLSQDVIVFNIDTSVDPNCTDAGQCVIGPESSEFRFPKINQFSSTDRDGLIIDGRNGVDVPNVVIDFANVLKNSAGLNVFEISKPHVSISNIVLRNVSNEETGIAIYGKTGAIDLTVKSVDFENNYKGIVIRAPGLTVLDSVFTDNTYGILALSPSNQNNPNPDDIEIFSSTFEGGDVGVSISDSINVSVGSRDNSSFGNKFYASEDGDGQVGLVIDNSNNVTIANNHFGIWRNLMARGLEVGIALVSSGSSAPDDSYIVDNVIASNGIGIYAGDVHRFKINGNFIGLNANQTRALGNSNTQGIGIKFQNIRTSWQGGLIPAVDENAVTRLVLVGIEENPNVFCYNELNNISAQGSSITITVTPHNNFCNTFTNDGEQVTTRPVDVEDGANSNAQGQSIRRPGVSTTHGRRSVSRNVNFSMSGTSDPSNTINIYKIESDDVISPTTATTSENLLVRTADESDNEEIDTTVFLCSTEADVDGDWIADCELELNPNTNYIAFTAQASQGEGDDVITSEFSEITSEAIINVANLEEAGDGASTAMYSVGGVHCQLNPNNKVVLSYKNFWWMLAPMLILFVCLIERRKVKNLKKVLVRNKN